MLSKAKKCGTVKKAILFTAAGYVIWSAAAMIFLAMPALDTLKFLLFQILAVALPGLAAYKLLNLKLSPLEALTVSYGLGIAALCILYFFFAPFGAMAYIKFGVLALTLASAAVLYLKRGSSFTAPERADSGEMRIALIFCAFAALTTFVIFSAATLNPAVAGARTFFHDTTNGVTLTVSASRGFPMTFLQMSGTENRYHISFFSYTSIMKLCTGISAFEIVTKLSLLTISPFFASAVICLAKRFLKKNPLVIIAGVLVLVLPENAMLHYYYQDVIGFPLGAVFSVLCALFFFEAEENEKKGINKFHLISLLFLIAALGAKGPVSVTIAFALCFCLLLKLIREKDWSVIPKGLLYVVPFFVVYFLVYAQGAGDSMSYSPIYSAIRTDFAHSIEGTMPDLLFRIISTVYYTITFDYVITLSFVALVLYLIFYKKKNSLVDFLFGGLLVGYVLINTMKQTGSSEWYFVLILAPFAVVALIYCVSALLDKLNLKAARTVKLSVFAVLVAAILYGNSAAAFGYYYGDPSSTLPMGVYAATTFSRFNENKILTDEQLNSLDKPDMRRSMITPEEYEAMLWLRDNTPEDAVIADSRYILSNKYFNGCAFSERSFYLEGFGFVTMEDANDNYEEKARREAILHGLYDYLDDGVCIILSSEGCDYVIISELVTPGFSVGEKYGTLMYENKDVKIYKLVEYGV